MSLFGKKKRAAAEANRETPYEMALRHHNNSVTAWSWSCRWWQCVALLSLMLALAAVGGLIVIGTQSRFIPYVVEVDKLGQTLAAGRADRAAVADGRVIRAMVATFIRDARMVSFDREVQNQAIWRVFSMMKPTDPALQKMTDYMKDANTSPTKRAETESVGIEIVSILPQNDRTWEITWTETAWNRNGQQIRKILMRGLVTVYSVPPTSSTSEDDILRNPLGLFVKEFSWSRMVE